MPTQPSLSQTGRSHSDRQPEGYVPKASPSSDNQGLQLTGATYQTRRQNLHTITKG
uniref:Uncharacterized protein n=1 Tax=Anguilla anguilla TaxID=7936 RepID=A0A0E9UV53_ANGAN